MLRMLQRWFGSRASEGAETKISEGVARKLEPQRLARELMALLNAIDEGTASRNATGNAAGLEEACRRLDTFTQRLRSGEQTPERMHVLGAAYRDGGSAYAELGQKEKAEKLFLEGVALRRAMAAMPGLGAAAVDELAACQNHLGMLYLDHNQLEDAAARFDEAIRIRRGIAEQHADESENLVYLAGALCNRGHCAGKRGEREVAVALYREAIDLLERTIPPCDCGCRDVHAQLVSQMTGHPHWIVTAHSYLRNCHAGLAYYGGQTR